MQRKICKSDKMANFKKLLVKIKQLKSDKVSKKEISMGNLKLSLTFSSMH